MNNNVITKNATGELAANRVFVVTCGCGGIVPSTKALIRKAGVEVAFLNTSVSFHTRQYIKQSGLRERIPSLLKNKHAVLYNPFTGRFIDLLNAPRTEQLYENIRRVVNE